MTWVSVYKRRDHLAEYRYFASQGIEYLGGRGPDTSIVRAASKRILDWVPLAHAHSGRFVDIGCGDASLLKLVSDNRAAAGISAWELDGVLPTQEECQLLRQHLDREGYANISVLQGKAQDLSAFPDGCATVVVLNGVLQLLEREDASKALSEIARITKLNGICIIGDLPTGDELGQKRRSVWLEIFDQSLRQGPRATVKMIGRILRYLLYSSPFLIERRTHFYLSVDDCRKTLTTLGFIVLEDRLGFPGNQSMSGVCRWDYKLQKRSVERATEPAIALC